MQTRWLVALTMGAVIVLFITWTFVGGTKVPPFHGPGSWPTIRENGQPECDPGLVLDEQMICQVPSVTP